MAVILKDTDATGTNSKYGYIVDMFDTVKDFKEYIKAELLNIQKSLKADNMEDKDLDVLIEKDINFWSFCTLFDKYKDYNFGYEFEIV